MGDGARPQGTWEERGIEASVGSCSAGIPLGGLRRPFGQIDGDVIRTDRSGAEIRWTRLQLERLAVQHERSP